eukprot:15453735-Alexandrium_andersonii.AAC.1
MAPGRRRAVSPAKASAAAGSTSTGPLHGSRKTRLAKDARAAPCATSRSVIPDHRRIQPAMRCFKKLDRRPRLVAAQWV